jgi:hypothetical protein
MLDFKKDFKDLYQPKSTPAIIEVPEMTFITVAGVGDPNTSSEYAAAIELLYGLSYVIKMGNKSVLEYVVAPLEGLWSVANANKDELAITNKANFIWTMLIRQPDFVTAELFEASKILLAKKKPQLNLTKANLEKFTEGLCVQVMHYGPYDNEPVTINLMNQYAIDYGYLIDLSAVRRHHEIYLTDPRKVAPEKLKTVIRHPIRKS